MTNLNMDDLLQEAPAIALPQLGELVEGRVVSAQKNNIVVDINGVMTGIISGREAKDSQDTVKGLKPGDIVLATVVEDENAEGMVVLSLRKASQQKTWQNFIKAFETGEIVEVVAKEANKGGLLLDIDGIKGFIPVSQLAPLHYPRVNGADAQLILERLQKLVGVKFKVKIINIDQENGKLILSEKAAYEGERKQAIVSLKVGDKVSGTISGVVKFGIFVAFDGLEGLVHISEIAWGHVKNPSDYGKLGDRVEVLVIGIDGDKISLSLKRLQSDPWLEAIQKFKIGDIVSGKVNRITEFGAFVKLDEDINGLIHLSELGDKASDPTQALKMEQDVKARIISLDADEHRIGLSLNLDAKPEDFSETKKEDGGKVAISERKKAKSAQQSLSSETKIEEVKDISKKYALILVEAGYKTLKDLKTASIDELIALDGIGKVSAEKIQKIASEV